MSPTTLGFLSIMLAAIAAAAAVAATVIFAQRSARLVELVADRLGAPRPPRHPDHSARPPARLRPFRNDDAAGQISGTTAAAAAAPSWDPRTDPLGAGEYRRRQETRYGRHGFTDTDRMNAIADGIAIGEGRRWGPPATWQQQPPDDGTPAPVQPWPNGQ